MPSAKVAVHFFNHNTLPFPRVQRAGEADLPMLSSPSQEWLPPLS